MTDLSTRILDCLTSSRAPLAANDIGQRLDEGVAEIMIALHELEQGGKIVSRLRGAKMRRYYEIAANND